MLLFMLPLDSQTLVQVVYIELTLFTHHHPYDLGGAVQSETVSHTDCQFSLQNVYSTGHDQCVSNLLS